MKALKISVVILSLGLGACNAQLPLATPFSPPPQGSLLVAGHWDAAAKDVADQLYTALSGIGVEDQPLVLHLRPAEHYTIFNQAFHDLLTTHLINRGFGVSRDPNVGLPVEYDVQTITYADQNPEIIVNVSIVNYGRYVTRLSDIYYVSDPNIYQYLARVPTGTRLVEVVGP